MKANWVEPKQRIGCLQKIFRLKTFPFRDFIFIFIIIFSLSIGYPLFYSRWWLIFSGSPSPVVDCNLGTASQLSEETGLVDSVNPLLILCWFKHAKSLIEWRLWFERKPNAAKAQLSSSQSWTDRTEQKGGSRKRGGAFDLFFPINQTTGRLQNEVQNKTWENI